MNAYLLILPTYHAAPTAPRVDHRSCGPDRTVDACSVDVSIHHAHSQVFPAANLETRLGDALDAGWARAVKHPNLIMSGIGGVVRDRVLGIGSLCHENSSLDDTQSLVSCRLRS